MVLALPIWLIAFPLPAIQGVIGWPNEKKQYVNECTRKFEKYVTEPKKLLTTKKR